MLRAILVVEPADEQRPAVVRALDGIDAVEVYEPGPVAGDGPSVASDLAARLGLTVRRDARLQAGSAAVALVEEIAAEADGTTVVVFATAEVVRAVVVHALAAPVAANRLLIEPGTLAEVEVRLDAPWTVNRLNDGCHL